MKKNSWWKLLIALAIYAVLVCLCASAGLIDAACFAYIGTIFPLFFAFLYLFVAAQIKTFGAASFLNGFFLIMAIILGEADLPLILGLIIFTTAAEIIRKIIGYEKLSGVKWSFVPLAYTFYAFSSHWWLDTKGTLEEARESMREGYADRIAQVVSNIPALVIALILVIPIAILGIFLATKIMKKNCIPAKLKFFKV